MNNEEAAFKLILHGGNARGEAYEALDAAEEFDFEKAQKHLDEAEKEFYTSHRYQTELIRDEKAVPNFLLVHAQDHVMTAQAELNLIKRLIDNYRYIHGLEKRLEKLESGFGE